MATKKLVQKSGNDKTSNSDWSTAKYANFKFDSVIGGVPTEPVLSEAVEDEKKVPSVEEEDSAEEKKDDEDKMQENADVVDPNKKDMPVAEAHDEEDKADASMSEAHDEEDKADASISEADEDEDEDELTLDANSSDASEDETMELDLSDLVDDDEEITELGSNDSEEVVGDAPVMSSDEDEENKEFADEGKMWEADDESLDIKSDEVEVKSEESHESDESDEEDTKSMSEEDDADEMNKKHAEPDGDEDGVDAEKKDAKSMSEEDEAEADKKHAEPVAEGTLKISFKMNEAKKLFENNTVLTEEDKRQSRSLFESAVRSVAKQIGAQLNEAYQARFTKVKKLHEAKVAAQVDQYLSYVVEQWTKDNKVALQGQLRNRLSDSFIAGLQKLCTEHYIQVPQSKINVVDALAKNVKSLKVRLKESEARNLKTHADAKQLIERERKALQKEHKARLIAEAASAVISSDRGSFTGRAETVTFTSTKEFKKDLIALREQYFVAKKSVERPTNEPVAVPSFEPKQSDTPVDAYAKFADRFTGRS